MTTEGKFDNVVGTGERGIAVGGYKVPVAKKDKEGKEYTDEETKYKFQIRFNVPGFSQDQINALIPVAVNRVISVKAAGMFNKDSGYGTPEDAKAFADAFVSGDTFFKFFMTKKEREKGEKVSGNTPLVQASRDCLELGLIIKKGFDPATISGADLKEIRKEVRVHQKNNTPQWQWALAKGEKELALRMKKAADLPD